MSYVNSYMRSFQNYVDTVNVNPEIVEMQALEFTTIPRSLVYEMPEVDEPLLGGESVLVGEEQVVEMEPILSTFPAQIRPVFGSEEYIANLSQREQALMADLGLEEAEDVALLGAEVSEAVVESAEISAEISGGVIAGSIAGGVVAAALLIGATMAGNYILKYVKEHKLPEISDDDRYMGCTGYLIIGKIWNPFYVNEVEIKAG